MHAYVCTYISIHTCTYTHNYIHVHKILIVHDVSLKYHQTCNIVKINNYLYVCIVDSPAISRLPTMQTVTLESQFVLLCNATGNPPPQIAWKKNGNAYTDSEHVNIAIQSLSGFTVSSLTISSAIHSDGGLYECVAANVLGIDTDNITVLVTGEIECIRACLSFSYYVFNPPMYMYTVYV